jgi:hypothetical protein
MKVVRKKEVGPREIQAELLKSGRLELLHHLT